MPVMPCFATGCVFVFLLTSLIRRKKKKVTLFLKKFFLRNFFIETCPAQDYNGSRKTKGETSLKEKIKEYSLMTIGVLFVVVGVYFFKFPNNYAIGGVTGFAMIVSNVLGGAVSSATLVTIINTILLIIGLLVLGKEFGIKTIYGSFLLSGSLQLLEVIYPMSAPFTSEPVLELAFAVGFPAIGAAILFNSGGSTGGTDIIAMILKKYSSFDIGQALFISDAVLTLLAFPTFGMQTGLLSFLGLVLKSTVVDSAIESMNLCKYFTVICDDAEPISRYIVQELRRSATVCDATGAFSGQNKKIVLTVLNRAQAVQLRQFIKHEQPTAFILITNTSEIIGRGFRGAN